MTIGLWILTILIGVCGIGFTAWQIWWNESIEKWLPTVIITLVLVGVSLFGGHWYCSSTATGARALKDQESNLNKGLMREITITAEDGREIFHYVGKCDIETTNEYILFEDENGLRQMIYWGIQDTIIISELPEK